MLILGGFIKINFYISWLKSWSFVSTQQLLVATTKIGSWLTHPVRESWCRLPSLHIIALQVSCLCTCESPAVPSQPGPLIIRCTSSYSSFAPSSCVVPWHDFLSEKGRAVLWYDTMHSAPYPWCYRLWDWDSYNTAGEKKECHLRVWSVKRAWGLRHRRTAHNRRGRQTGARSVTLKAEAVGLWMGHGHCSQVVAQRLLPWAHPRPSRPVGLSSFFVMWRGISSKEIKTGTRRQGHSKTDRAGSRHSAECEWTR